MKIAILKERRLYEKRVAVTPDTVKKFKDLGFDVWVEQGAGVSASFLDDAYKTAGAHIGENISTTLKDADLILKVQRPLLKGEGEIDELSFIKKGSCLLGILGGTSNEEVIKAYIHQGIVAFSMDLIPRITRAQSMDVLSSQSSLAGYRATLEAVHAYGRVLPMMITAAGTLMPAKVLILGAGVAGLQAIATARRLGAVVSAFDVRSAAKEQVESLGATFISHDETEETGDGTGGYAREMSSKSQEKHALLIHDALKKTNIAITSALIPGKKAPVLITEKMVDDMMPGSIILDMAVESGGNCTLSRLGDVLEHNHVKIMGIPNLASGLPRDASYLYAKNLCVFVNLLIDSTTHNFVQNLNDEILKSTCLTPHYFNSPKER